MALICNSTTSRFEQMHFKHEQRIVLSPNSHIQSVRFSTHRTKPTCLEYIDIILDISLDHRSYLLRLHGQFCVVSLPYMDNEWSVSERNLLSQRPEQANALATSTGRRLVMKCTWPRSRGTRLAPSTAGIQCLSPDKIRLHRYSY